MTLPADKDIRLPLLKVIADAGGELPAHDAIHAVQGQFPQITKDDLLLRRASGVLLWDNRVRWVRQNLVLTGYLNRLPKGVWSITPKGRSYLEQNWKTSTGTVQQAPDGPRLHKELEDKLSHIALLLGYHAETEFSEAPYRYDVVWKEYSGAVRPEAVFEVQDKGNLIEALAKLQHAKDIWGSHLFLVVTGEKDQKKAQLLTGTYLAGTFHRLAPFLTVLTPERVGSLFTDLGRHAELLQRLVQK